MLKLGGSLKGGLEGGLRTRRPLLVTGWTREDSREAVVAAGMGASATVFASGGAWNPFTGSCPPFLKTEVVALTSVVRRVRDLKSLLGGTRINSVSHMCGVSVLWSAG